jgi:hypothetical protein
LLGTVAVSVALLATSSKGQTSTPVVAEALFQEARELMRHGEFTSACPKLEESQRLDPKGGTLLNLAVCHQGAGKRALAWTEYRQALAQAIREGRADRVELARDRLAKLDAQLSRIVLVVPNSVRLAGLVVQLDGTVMGQATWGSRIPVDEGEHTIVASAPKHKSWTHSLAVGAAQTVQVRLGELEPVEPVRTPPPRTPAPKRETIRQDASATARTSDSSATLGCTLGSVGLLSLAAGTYFGVRAVQLDREADEGCRDGCSAEDSRLSESAVRNAWIANASLGLGLALTGLGAYVILGSPPAQSPAQHGVSVRLGLGRADVHAAF